jgi:hypothetical protein
MSRPGMDRDAPKCVKCGGPAGGCDCWKQPVAPKASAKRRTSPTQRTLAALRAEGYVAAVVEHWNAHAFVRQDLFGFADVVALRPGEILAVQACSGGGGDHAERRAKIVGPPPAPEPGKRRPPVVHARAWLEAGGRIEVWSWRKKLARWVVRREPIVIEDLPAPPVVLEQQLSLPVIAGGERRVGT